jgi:hypothetical protein
MESNKTFTEFAFSSTSWQGRRLTSKNAHIVTRENRQSTEKEIYLNSRIRVPQPTVLSKVSVCSHPAACPERLDQAIGKISVAAGKTAQ